MRAIKTIVIGALALATFPAWASTTFVATPVQLNANDTLTWGQLGPTGSALTNPVTVVTGGGRAVTVSQAMGHGFTSTAGAGYGPMYARGERLYLTDNGFGFSGGPLTFVFEHDINGFGVVCDPDYYLSGFAGTISAYDAADQLLGAFSFSVSAQATYKQVFAGVADTTAAIHRVVIDGTAASQSPEDFSVGTVLIDVDQIFADDFE